MCLKCFLSRENQYRSFIPQSTQPPPTEGRRRGSCRAVSPRVSPGRPWYRGRCTLSCPGPARASSNSELDETENPPHRSWSTRSSCSPPIWNTTLVDFRSGPVQVHSDYITAGNMVLNVLLNSLNHFWLFKMFYCTWADILSQYRSRGPAPVWSEHHSTYRAPRRRHNEYMWRRTLILLDCKQETISWRQTY